MEADFRAAKSKRITDNFLRVATAVDHLVFVDPDGKEESRQEIDHPDWFKDADFDTVV